MFVEESYLPSKKFIKISTISIVVLAIILSFQTNWFKNLFNKNTNQNKSGVTTIGQSIIKDSNGNGIPDWEEVLWGLDPTVLYTGTMSNKEIIENKKKTLGLPSGPETLNESQRLARELLIFTLSSNQNNVSDLDIEETINKMVDGIEFSELPNKYNITNIKTVPTTLNSVKNYKNKQEQIFSKYKDEESSALVWGIINTRSYEFLPELLPYAEQYRKVESELSQIEVPIGMAKEHATILNSLYGISKSFEYLASGEEDGVKLLNGAMLYQNYLIYFEAAIQSYVIFLTEYGII